MRSLKALYTIPAHLSNVADVRFFRRNGEPPTSLDVSMNGVDPDPDSNASKEQSADKKDEDVASASEEWRYRNGLYFASAGYDGLVKLWSADDWQLLRTLSTDAGKVMSVDLSRDGKMLASGTYNRNFQLFSPEEV
jgi:U4/U6 small nuclear ribonucleoprotein PRP4